MARHAFNPLSARAAVAEGVAEFPRGLGHHGCGRLHRGLVRKLGTSAAPGCPWPGLMAGKHRMALPRPTSHGGGNRGATGTTTFLLDEFCEVDLDGSRSVPERPRTDRGGHVLGATSRPQLRLAPYDGSDPNNARGADLVVTPIVGKHGPRSRNSDGRIVGHLELRKSPKCGTIWAKVYFDGDAGKRYAGEEVELKMVRPADGARAPFLLPLTGGNFGYGNMLSATESCVHAEARFVRVRKGSIVRSGPVARTDCYLAA